MWFDIAVVETIRNAVPTRLAVVLLLISFLGSVYVIVPAVAAAVVSNVRWRTSELDTWPGIVIGGYGLFVSLKPLFSVHRPPVDPPFTRETLPLWLEPLYGLGVGFGSASFPSGHALAATVFWGLVVLELPIATRRKRALVGGAVVALVCLSRVALGVHYPGDVVAGVGLGLLYLGVVHRLRALAADPVRLTLLVGGALAAGGFLSGRYVDAAILLAAATVAGTGHWLRVRSGTSPRASRSDGGSDSNSSL